MVEKPSSRVPMKRYAPFNKVITSFLKVRSTILFIFRLCTISTSNTYRKNMYSKQWTVQKTKSLDLKMSKSITIT